MDRRFLFGAQGWDHPGWCGSYYPEDLPASWRLSYYANDFPAVLLSDGDWNEQPLDEIIKWVDEVPEGFCFYLMLLDDQVAVADLRRRLKGFAGHLGGVLLGEDLSVRWAKSSLCGLGREFPFYFALALIECAYPVAGSWRLGTSEVVLLDECASGDLKTQRSLLDQLNAVDSAHGRTALFLQDAGSGCTYLEQLRTLLALFGQA